MPVILEGKRKLFAILAICFYFAASQAGAAVSVSEVSRAAIRTDYAKKAISNNDEARLLGGEFGREYSYQYENGDDAEVTVLRAKMFDELEALTKQVADLEKKLAQMNERKNLRKKDTVPIVPFYSQFADISSPQWQKVGCGIASVAMLIDYFTPDPVSVEELLSKGRAAGYFLSDAGWTHAGLIALSKPFGLTGESKSLAGMSPSAAFSALETALASGPVMASVHYTFEPTNPIPHLVVVNGVKDGLVYYNDPAEKKGGGSISIEKFQRAWKQRYIEIRPVS